ncbi:hypothetical protein ACFSTC_28765 [Nonomuraea ferruginea]
MGHAPVVAGGCRRRCWRSARSPCGRREPGRSPWRCSSWWGLATTAPLALLPGQPAVAAAVVTVSVLLSLTAFQTLTVAGGRRPSSPAGTGSGGTAPGDSPYCSRPPFPCWPCSLP